MQPWILGDIVFLHIEGYLRYGGLPGTSPSGVGSPADGKASGRSVEKPRCRGGLCYLPNLRHQTGANRNTVVDSRAAVLPGKRVGTAEEVAQVMLMVMTNPYVNGTVLHVDGAGRFV